MSRAHHLGSVVLGHGPSESNRLCSEEVTVTAVRVHREFLVFFFFFFFGDAGKSSLAPPDGSSTASFLSRRYCESLGVRAGAGVGLHTTAAQSDESVHAAACCGV